MSSRYHQTQKFLQNYYNLSDNELSGLVNQMPPNDVYQYIGHKAEVLNKSIDPTRNNRLQQKIYDNDYWRKSYQTIKAESWPSCDSIEDFYNLPYEIQQECQLVHKFSPDIWFNENLTFDTFTKSQEWNYEIADLVKSKHLVLDNIDIIQNKNVIDFSTHTGSVAGLCLHQGAKHVTFTEIRSNFLELASERMSLMGFDTTCYRAELADIHEYETNTALCVDKDTVILSGVIYHVHDHCAILESIVKAKPKVYRSQSR